jgi:hypothetical protein
MPGTTPEGVPVQRHPVRKRPSADNTSPATPDTGTTTCGAARRRASYRCSRSGDWAGDWAGDWVVREGARLESGYTVMNRIVSSNLIPSAISPFCNGNYPKSLDFH